MQRVALALSFIKGDKVDQWAYSMANWLAEQVYREDNPTLPTDERLWNEFVFTFRRQFVDTGEAERAWTKLTSLAMKESDIDQYIADFEVLIVKSGKSREDSMCVDFFKLGLKTWLHNAILNRRPIPRTLDQWQVTAREEVEAQALKKANIGAKPKYWLSARESLWQNSQTKTKEKEKKPRDPDAMEIDAVRTSNMSSKERQELMKDGKCFY